MPDRHIIELPQARIEIEERPGYVFIVESGQIRALDELRRYTSSVESVMKKLEIDKALIDARGEIGEPPESVRMAMWQWLLGGTHGFSAIAFVLPSEIAATRVNMTAVAKGASIRAFETVSAARRWLSRGARQSTGAIRTSPSSRPPPLRSDVAPQHETRLLTSKSETRTKPERPGAYFSSTPQVERPLGDIGPGRAAGSRRKKSPSSDVA